MANMQSMKMDLSTAFYSKYSYNFIGEEEMSTLFINFLAMSLFNSL